MDDFLTFMNSNEALEKNFDYLMFGLEVNTDQLNGLDSYTTENDERMVEILSDLKKKQGGH